MDFPSDGTDGGEDDGVDERAYAVRPYAITGGRTRAGARHHLPVEALVDQYLSVAELSAHIEVPVGVVRVLIGDLADEGLVRVHGLSSSTSSSAATSLSVLESVLNGISSL